MAYPVHALDAGPLDDLKEKKGGAWKTEVFAYAGTHAPSILGREEKIGLNVYTYSEWGRIDRELLISMAVIKCDTWSIPIFGYIHHFFLKFPFEGADIFSDQIKANHLKGWDAKPLA